MNRFCTTFKTYECYNLTIFDREKACSQRSYKWHYCCCCCCCWDFSILLTFETFKLLWITMWLFILVVDDKIVMKLNLKTIFGAKFQMFQFVKLDFSRTFFHFQNVLQLKLQKIWLCWRKYFRREISNFLCLADWKVGIFLARIITVNLEFFWKFVKNYPRYIGWCDCAIPEFCLELLLWILNFVWKFIENYGWNWLISSKLSFGPNPQLHNAPPNGTPLAPRLFN